MSLSNLSQNLGADGHCAEDVPQFNDHLVTLTHFLPWRTLRNLQDQTDALSRAERSYVPTHKKGGTFAYETILKHSPGAADLYRSLEMRAHISKIVGLDVEPTPLHDQNSLSVLVYDRPGDHIGWHYDHNFY